MYRNHDARRLEHLTVLVVLAIVVLVGGGALLGAKSLSHTLSVDSRSDTGDPASQPPPTTPSAATTTTSTTTPPTSDAGPSFSPSTDVTVVSGFRLQLAGQVVAEGATLRVTVVAQVSAAPGRNLVGQPIAISNNNQCMPGQWLGYTDHHGQAMTTFSCAAAGGDVALSASSGTARYGLVLHR